MKHTLLIEEGIWVADGTYLNEHNRSILVKGELNIKHHKDVWINSCTLELKGSNPHKIRNQYEITPLNKNLDSFTWESKNPAYTKLKGKITSIGDSFISIFRSEDSELYGIEYLIKVSADHYKNRGYSFHESKKLASWSIEVKRLGHK